MNFSNEFVGCLREVISHNDNIIALHEPKFVGNEWKYVKECIDTGWVSSVGKFVDTFEANLANFTGAKYVIATVNGTAALHVCFLLSGILPGDEILVPTITFVATTNAISYCQATPHFIDSEESSLGIDVDLLDEYLKNTARIKNKICFNKRTGRPIRALCVMHMLGHPVDLDALDELCSKYHLVLIEDAAEALGSYYKGVHVGHRGLVGALSFNGNKIVTTGGGGAILTNDEKIAKQAKHITTTAKLPHPWLFEHDQVAYNYRLPNLNAALGCAQLEQLPYFISVKRMLAQKYQVAFTNLKNVRVIKEPIFAKSNYWLNAILLEASNEDLRNKLLKILQENKVMARPLWNLQHTLKMFENCPRMPLPIAECLYKRLIKLPSSACLVQIDVKETMESSKEIWNA